MPKKILIIEDEAHMAESIERRLKASSYETVVASDGQEGLEKARTENPDLVILDIMLPKIDGFQVCRMLKFDNNYRKIPIIMLTAKAEDEDFKTGEKVGADVYLTKPFDSKILLSKIKEYIGAAEHGKNKNNGSK